MKKSEANETTMIKLKKGTRARLKALKRVDESESYDEVIKWMLEHIPDETFAKDDERGLKEE